MKGHLSLRSVGARAALWLGLAIAVPAHAHDSWFAEQPARVPGEVRLTLATGEMFPRQQSSVGGGALVVHGCTRGQGRRVPLVIVGDRDEALHLRARPQAPKGSTAPGGVTCWAGMPTFELEVPADKVGLYLDEVRASAQLRATWAAMQARGLPWRERYTKHARYERFAPALAGAAPGVSSPALQPAPMGMDIVLRGPLPPQAGDSLEFTVLRDGRPLPGQPIELRNDRLPIGQWVHTDDQGRAEVRLPFAATYLLRGVDLRPVPEQPEHAERWDSRFVTLSFTVEPRRP